VCVNHSALRVKNQPSTHELLSHYGFTGTFTGTFAGRSGGQSIKADGVHPKRIPYRNRYGIIGEYEGISCRWMNVMMSPQTNVTMAMPKSSPPSPLISIPSTVI
jgi:hypothetical protein